MKKAKETEALDTTDPAAWKVWGVPVNLSWWKTQSDAFYLDLYNGAWPFSGKRWFASMVAGALEEVTSWRDNGVVIAGKNWLDVGGASGYYAVALKLLGAASVTLIDESQPDEAAAEVLRAAGILVVLTDGNEYSDPTADAACILYVPSVDAHNVLDNNPRVTQLCFEDNWTEPEDIIFLGWKCERLKSRNFLMLGEGGICRAPESHKEMVWHCTAPTSPIRERPERGGDLSAKIT